MIRRIVMWKFAPDAGEKKQEFLQGLQALTAEIPQMLKCEIHESMNTDDFDAVGIIDFESPEAMEEYIVHPSHQAIAEFCKTIRINRGIVDFEI